MIITQTPYIDGNGKEHSNLVRHYSDAGMYIRQKETGVEYAEAIDTIPCKYTYEETDITIASNSELVNI